MWSAKQVTYNKHIHPTGNKWSGHNIVQWFGKHVLFIRWMELNHQSFKTEQMDLQGQSFKATDFKDAEAKKLLRKYI